MHIYRRKEYSSPSALYVFRPSLLDLKFFFFFFFFLFLFLMPLTKSTSYSFISLRKLFDNSKRFEESSRAVKWIRFNVKNNCVWLKFESTELTYYVQLTHWSSIFENFFQRKIERLLKMLYPFEIFNFYSSVY